MKKRWVALCVACTVLVSTFSGTVFAAESTDDIAYLGLGTVANFREGPGSDSTGTPVYTINYTFVAALFDAQGRIIDTESDILEIATPNYEGKNMPLFSGWPGSDGYNTVDHATETVKPPTEVTVDTMTAELAGWKTKRERGDLYGMNPANDWTPQMNFYEEWFKGKTVAQIWDWFGKNTTAAGRPIKPTTTNEADLAKLAKLSEAEKADLADVLSGATMSLQDPHGLTLDALQKAYNNRIPVKMSEVASLGLGTDKTFRAGPGTDEEKNPIYSFNIVTSAVAFNANGAIAASVSDIMEVSTPNYDGASMPHFLGWPNTTSYFIYDHATKTLISPEKSASATYTVVANDVLWKIAKKFDTTIDNILSLNPQIKNKNLIYAGDVLAISSTSASLTDVASAKAAVNSWQSKRERGDSYGMKAGNDWYQQMNFYQDWMVGKTMAEVRAWFGSYTTAAGRPIKADTTNEADKAKYEKLTDAEKAQLADVVSGATMSIEDPHGKVVTAMEMAYKLAKPVVAVPVQEAAEADVVSSATVKESSDPAAIANGLSKDGYWIFSILSDVKLDETLEVNGTFHDKDNPESKVYRKLALYAQDADHNVTAQYTLTVPKMVVTSPSFRIQNGTVVGDIYVDADGFELSGSTVTGNVFFKTQAQLDSALLEKGTITGSAQIGAVDEADVVSSATVKESSDPATIANGLSKDGYWIFSILSDVKLEGTLEVNGTFHDKDNPESKVYRKLALYAQDADHKVTAQYTLTVPKMVVTSPNFRIQNGTVVGDIYVNAEGFELSGSTVTGNVFFKTQAQLDSALLEKGTITGSAKVE